VTEAVTIAIIAATPATMTAVGAIIVAVRQGRSTRQHVAAVGRRVEHAATELTPNHGSSVHDKVDQAVAGIGRLEKSIGGLRDDARNDREATNRRFEGLDRRVGALDDRVVKVERRRNT